jgi:hypothetical protein
LRFGRYTEWSFPPSQRAPSPYLPSLQALIAARLAESPLSVIELTVLRRAADADAIVAAADPAITAPVAAPAACAAAVSAAPTAAACPAAKTAKAADAAATAASGGTPAVPAAAAATRTAASSLGGKGVGGGSLVVKAAGEAAGTRAISGFVAAEASARVGVGAIAGARAPPRGVWDGQAGAGLRQIGYILGGTEPAWRGEERGGEKGAGDETREGEKKESWGEVSAGGIHEETAGQATTEEAAGKGAGEAGAEPTMEAADAARPMKNSFSLGGESSGEAAGCAANGGAEKDRTIGPGARDAASPPEYSAVRAPPAYDAARGVWTDLPASAVAAALAERVAGGRSRGSAYDPSRGVWSDLTTEGGRGGGGRRPMNSRADPAVLEAMVRQALAIGDDGLLRRLVTEQQGMQQQGLEQPRSRMARPEGGVQQKAGVARPVGGAHGAGNLPVAGGERGRGARRAVAR